MHTIKWDVKTSLTDSSLCEIKTARGFIYKAPYYIYVKYCLTKIDKNFFFMQ